MTEKGFKTDVEFGELHVSSDDHAGYRPYQLLLASVAVCSGGILRKILDKKRMSYACIKIDTDMERDKTGRVISMHLHFIITGLQVDHNAMEKMLRLTRRNCQMVQSVQEAIKITESFELLNE